MFRFLGWKFLMVCMVVWFMSLRVVGWCVVMMFEMVWLVVLMVVNVVMSVIVGGGSGRSRSVVFVMMPSVFSESTNSCLRS